MGQKQDAQTWEAVLAATIRAERARAGMSPVEMATVTGIPRTTLWRIEKGTGVISAAHVRAISAALGFTPGRMYELVDEGTRNLDREYIARHQPRTDPRPDLSDEPDADAAEA